MIRGYLLFAYLRCHVRHARGPWENVRILLANSDHTTSTLLTYARQCKYMTLSEQYLYISVMVIVSPATRGNFFGSLSMWKLASTFAVLGNVYKYFESQESKSMHTTIRYITLATSF